MTSISMKNSTEKHSKISRVDVGIRIAAVMSGCLSVAIIAEHIDGSSVFGESGFTDGGPGVGSLYQAVERRKEKSCRACPRSFFGALLMMDVIKFITPRSFTRQVLGPCLSPLGFPGKMAGSHYRPNRFRISSTKSLSFPFSLEA